MFVPCKVSPPLDQDKMQSDGGRDGEADRGVGCDRSGGGRIGGVSFSGGRGGGERDGGGGCDRFGGGRLSSEIMDRRRGGSCRKITHMAAAEEEVEMRRRQNGSFPEGGCCLSSATARSTELSQRDSSSFSLPPSSSSSSCQSDHLMGRSHPNCRHSNLRRSSMTARTQRERGVRAAGWRSVSMPKRRDLRLPHRNSRLPHHLSFPILAWPCSGEGGALMAAAAAVALVVLCCLGSGLSAVAQRDWFATPPPVAYSVIYGENHLSAADFMPAPFIKEPRGLSENLDGSSSSEGSGSRSGGGLFGVGTKTPLSLIGAGQQEANAVRLVLPVRSRFRDLNRAFHALRVTVKAGKKKLEFCIHSNASRALAACPSSEWRPLDNRGIWSVHRSPFETTYVDVRTALGSAVPSEGITVTVREEFGPHRVIFLFVGFFLVMAAPYLSQVVLFYYGAGMGLGIFLVAFIVLFQIMKLLPFSRRNTFQMVLYSTLLGIGAAVVNYLAGFVRYSLNIFGFGEEVVSPVVVLLALLFVLGGAGLGVWTVRKFVLYPDSTLDTATKAFVRWSLTLIGGALLLMSSADAVLGTTALLLGCTSIPLTVCVQRTVRRVVSRGTPSRDEEEDVPPAESPGTPVREASRTRSPSPSLHHLRLEGHQQIQQQRQQQFSHQYQQQQQQQLLFRQQQQQQQQGLPPATPVRSLLESSALLSQPMASSFHATPQQRRFMTPQQAAVVSREATRLALQDLARSPAYGEWLAQNVDRIQLTPMNLREERSTAEIRATAYMEPRTLDDGDSE